MAGTDLGVPFADVGPIKVPNGIPEKKVVFQPCDVIVVWGCGPALQRAHAGRTGALQYHSPELRKADPRGVRVEVLLVAHDISTRWTYRDFPRTHREKLVICVAVIRVPISVLVGE